MLHLLLQSAAPEPILHPLDQWIIIGYMGVVLLVGVWYSRRVHSSADFFLAGKALPFWAIGMSIVVSDIGALDMMSGAGATYRYGLAQANFDWIGSVPGMIIAAFVFMPFFWRSGVATVPEFLGRRYGRGVQNVQMVIWLGFLVVMLAVMIWTSAVFLNTVLGWSTQRSIWVTSIVVGTYTMLGGLTAVVMTDVIQAVIMFVGAGTLLFRGLDMVGGWSGLAEKIEARGPELADHLRLLLPNDTDAPYPWGGIVFGLGLVLSTAYFSGNQAVMQRVLGAKSEWHARASMLFAALLKLLIPVLIMLPGLIARILHPSLEKADAAVPTLVRELLPVGLLGMMFAAFFAAFMSSVDSYLNSATTIFITDVYRPLRGAFGAAASDRECLWLGRILTLVLIFTAASVAPVIDEFKTLYEATQTLFSLFQGPTLAILSLGVLWSRINGIGALLGLLSGVSLSVIINLASSVEGVPEADKIFPGGEPFLFASFWSFLTAVVVTTGVSLATRRPPDERIRGLVFGHQFGALRNAKALAKDAGGGA